MTQPSDFKAAVSSLLSSFADALNAVADELVASLSPATTTSDGDVVPGTVSVPVANPEGETVEAAPSVLPDGTPVPQPEVVTAPTTLADPTLSGTTQSETSTGAAPSEVPTTATDQAAPVDSSPAVSEPSPSVLPDGTPVPQPEATPGAAADPTPDNAPPISTSTPSEPVTTTDATDPTSDIGTNA